MMVIPGNSQHIGSRKEQQDSFGFSNINNRRFTSKSGGLVVVADGMGGLSQGRQASQIAVKTFIKAYEQKKQDEKIPNTLLRCIHESNDAVLEFAKSQSIEGKTGTTLVAAVVHNQDLYWISVGDSRAYHLHQDKLTCLTTDHNYSITLDGLVAKGEMSEEEASKDSNRNALISFIGSDELSLIGRNTSPIKCFEGRKL